MADCASARPVHGAAYGGRAERLTLGHSRQMRPHWECMPRTSGRMARNGRGPIGKGRPSYVGPARHSLHAAVASPGTIAGQLGAGGAS